MSKHLTHSYFFNRLTDYVAFVKNNLLFNNRINNLTALPIYHVFVINNV